MGRTIAGHRHLRQLASRRTLALAAAALTLLWLTFACAVKTPSKSAPGELASTPGPTIVKGLALSPQGFPDRFDQVGAFLDQVGGMPNAGVMWNGNWRDPGGAPGEIPEGAALVAGQADTHGYVPILVLGWRSGSELDLGMPQDATDNWSNLSARQAYRQAAVAIAARYHPAFLFLGNENDTYFEQDPEDYLRWVSAYDDAYAAVKLASPLTRVGPVFTYEHLAGMGGRNGWTSSWWGAFESHDLSKVDIVGLTLYPWLNQASPSELPPDYLAPLAERLQGKPLAITETGWPAAAYGDLPPLWEASEGAQAMYIQALPDLLAGVDVRLVDWLYLYPPVKPKQDSLAWDLFGSISLLDAEGRPRPAFPAWQAFQLQGED